MGQPFLVIRLEGPFQSWGEHSNWDYRDTADFPTKSGVIGIIACAMGLERGNEKIAELSDAISMAVRADRRGLIRTDFQTITGEPMAKANGERRSTGNTIISRKSYLLDASFLVVLSGSFEVLRECADALSNPVWQIYLGRKNCVPSLPITGTISDNFNTVEELMANWPLSDRHDDRVLVQYESINGDGFYRYDNIIKGSKRNFLRRKVVNEVIFS